MCNCANSATWKCWHVLADSEPPMTAEQVAAFRRQTELAWAWLARESERTGVHPAHIAWPTVEQLAGFAPRPGEAERGKAAIVGWTAQQN